MKNHSPVGAILLLALLPFVLQNCQRSAHTLTDGSIDDSLDGAWRFSTDPDNRGLREHWFDPDFDRSVWDTLDVPGYWDAKGLENYDGIGWYARSFDLTLRDSLRRALVFDAVDDNAEIWFNGVRVGAHVGYGQRFFADVTGLLRERGNLAVVRVEDLGGPGGLMGSVRLRAYRDENELLRGPYHDSVAVESPDWVRDAVIYEVYTRSFSKEGSFTALRRRLGELKRLGVTVLWLMPIHPVGEVKRKGTLGSPYAVKDFDAVNPELGTRAEFDALLRAVHDSGLRLIIDLVINHTAWDNPLLREHPDWYTRNARGVIISPNQDWHDVADLDYRNPALRRWMIDMMARWVRAGVDGFRCDVAEMVPIDFWREAIPALRAIRPVMMLAEGTAPELHVGAFDMTYAWNTYDVLLPILEGRSGVSDLDAALTRERYQFPRGALRLRFTTNHDKNAYDAPPVVRYGTDGAKAVAVLAHTLPGVPLIYNGQEVGTDRRMSLFEKEEIDWSRDPHGFGPLYSTLNRLRREHPALRRGDMRRIEAKQFPYLYTFTRSFENDTVLVAINLSASACALAALEANLSGFTLELGNPADRSTLRLPGFGSMVLSRKL